MSCPLFLPTSPLGDFMAAGMPLGDVYGGTCAAAADAHLPHDKIRRCCNVGYARATCEHARLSPADAARFLVTADRGGVVEVAWSLERDHHPVRVGTLEVAAEDSAAAAPIELQARACAASYLRRMGRA
jgi:hypothetical protein